MRALLIQRDFLTPSLELQMFRLLETQFDGLDLEIFRADLDNKNWVLLVQSDDEASLLGFTTLAHYSRCFDGEALDVIVSGDTVMTPDGWRRCSLSHFWIPAIEHIRDLHARGPLYWLLISSGFRSYRFLPVFAKSYYPCHARPTPERVKALIDYLARDRFGKQYDPITGLVKFNNPQTLKPHLQDIRSERVSNPDVEYFLKANPGYNEGDELVCLASLERDNYTKLASKLAGYSGREKRALEVVS